MGISRILIANRGEIALRIHRAAHEMGIETVAVHSTADADAMHVRLADHAVCIGPPCGQGQLSQHGGDHLGREITHADAIHPGYGFLSENAQFAEIVESHDITWIGPKPEHIRTMGDKIEAKRTAGALRPAAGSRIGRRDLSDIGGQGDRRKSRLSGDHQGCHRGGGGRGMKVVHGPDELETLMQQAGTEAKAAFGDATTVYMEKVPRQSAPHRIPDVRRRQWQVRSIWASAIARCSAATRRCWKKPLARSSQPEAERERMGGIVAKAMADMGYRGAGRSSSCWENGEFYFIEMNTRLQVEHPVTEAITGVDLVREQIRIADGKPLVGAAGRRSSSTATRSNAGSTPRTPRPSCPRPAGDRATTPRAACTCASIPGSMPAISVPPYYDSA